MLMFDWLKKEEEEREKHSLPSFPDSPFQKGFAQSAIKDAVEDNKLPSIPKSSLKELPDIPSPPHLEHNNSEEHHEPTKMPLPHMPDEKLEEQKEFHNHHHSDVFIKIDKFKSAKRSLEITKEKLVEVEDIIKKLRETTTREEAHLNSWEKELDTVRNKVREVSENIFEKVE